jgi:hypothetical protein
MKILVGFQISIIFLTKKVVTFSLSLPQCSDCSRWHRGLICELRQINTLDGHSGLIL